MNQKILTISVILVFCILCAGLTTASTTIDKTPTDSTASTVEIANITSIDPTSGKLGETVNFILNGTGFSKSNIILLNNGDPKNPYNIIAKAVNLTSDSTITGSFDIPKNVNLGSWIINIKQRGQMSSSNVIFTITE